jgi:hypothetical protein
MAEQLEGLER